MITIFYVARVLEYLIIERYSGKVLMRLFPNWFRLELPSSTNEQDPSSTDNKCLDSPAVFIFKAIEIVFINLPLPCFYLVKTLWYGEIIGIKSGLRPNFPAQGPDMLSGFGN